MLLPVDHNVGLKRETASGAIINTDMASFLNVQRQKEIRNEKESKVQRELDELRKLVELLMEKK